MIGVGRVQAEREAAAVESSLAVVRRAEGLRLDRRTRHRAAAAQVLSVVWGTKPIRRARNDADKAKGRGPRSSPAPTFSSVAVRLI
jgi:hypothetical protein